MSALAPMQPLAADKHAYFGQSMPASIGDLPPGLLRAQLKNLPAPAQARALQWLHGFEFPAADVAFLRADPQGGIFYEDPAQPSDPAGSTGDTPAPAAATPLNVFALHSKPGASRVVYLDMDGHVVTGTAWNASSGFASLNMEAFDTDGDPSTFNSSEVEDIAETWKRVAEDYAPYDIDVTTQEPASFGPNVGHILVSPVQDANGNYIYSDGYGGVAYVGVWGRSNFTYYQPALVFPDNLGYDAKNMAEAASHELGHNLGLSHDGTSTAGYYSGHGSGNTSWAPIMGVGYYTNVTQWSRGEYTDANNQQDDLSIIAGYLSYRMDDHADADFNAATPLVRSDTTTISATNPVSDPDNFNPNNKGIIGDRNDVDLFYVDVNAGTIDLTVTPVWIEDFYWHSRRSANLDVHTTLYDMAGNVVDQGDPSDDTFARVTATVPAGRYILAVEGVSVRTPADGYSDYGSIGQYFINGTVPNDITYSEPPTAPGDLTATLNAEGNGIALVWTDPPSTVDTNETGYRVFRQVDGGVWAEVANLPQDSSAYSDNNLGNGSYVYNLEVYNGSGSNASNLTEAITISAPVYAYATSESTAAGTILSGSYLDTKGDTASEVLAEAHQGGKPSSRVSVLDHSWHVTGIEPAALVTLEVEAEAPANAEGDDFRLSYSVNGGASIEVGVVTNGTGRQTLSAVLPSSVSGALTLRVVDTDRTAGNGSGDSLSVYRIRVTSTGDPQEQTPVVSITDPVDGYTSAQGVAFDLAAIADDYEDGDLSAEISWSSDIDGHLHTGGGFSANTAQAPLTIGTHLMTASVTDSAGKVGESSISVTITDPNAATDVYLAGLVGASQADRNKWSVTITVTVRDDHGDAVANAAVTGDWSGAASGSASCVTDGTGQCTLSKGGLQTRNPSVTFTATDIAHATLSYAPELNLVVDAITVNAP
jgi:hypothetical protein